MNASRIMIVEDEGIIAMDIRKLLEGFGYQVVAIAFSGGQAISLAAEQKPDLIMMDIVLKGSMDGISAAQIIKDSLDIPVIFLTAYSDAATLQRAKTAGAYGYLIKPFRADEMHSSIEVALYKHKLECKLKESEQWFAKTLHCISDAVIATDNQGNVQFMNPVAEALTGWSLKSAKGCKITEIMTLKTESDLSVIDNPVLKALHSRALARLSSTTFLLNRTNTLIPIDDGAAPIIGNNGTLLGAVLVFRDITERLEIERRLRESEERFHSAFEQAAIGMALVSIDGRFLQVNSSICEILGYTHEELLNTLLQDHVPVDHYEQSLSRHLNKVLSNQLLSFQTEVQCQHKKVDRRVWTLISVSLVRNDVNEPLYFIIQVQDISERKAAERKLLYIANHDPLTGLLNRVNFLEQFNQALSAMHRHDNKLALLFLDLDRFKLINDTLGHRIGDCLIKAVSERLKKAIRSNDILARLGGDEFILMLSDIIDINDIGRIAQKIIDTLAQPFSFEEQDIVITASIGISVYPNDGQSSHDLMMNADTAMYLAKERGKNNYQFYTLEMTTRSLERMTIERGLRLALKNGEFVLEYQPQINPVDGCANSVEALVRWRHPEWGLVYPDRFIGIAEETGLIVAIGLWVLRTACIQVKAWQDSNSLFKLVAVNLSARQFQEPDLFDCIKTVLDETGLQPSALELEITESAVMQDPKRTLEILQQLNELGVRLSIDDFGTGYSSLMYLRQFPVHSVKIDRSFVQNIPDDEGSMTLVRAIIALAHELKLDVTAEGVEDLHQYQFLKTQNCDMLQGYLFSRPVRVEKLETDFSALIDDGFGGVI
ncbi:EAL domain-containing protein [Methylomonas sp. AM2-LC]|uniref:GGDEF domain-containing response regulator n=1 Tax=Methylomonas sp. AM2-LC TaxID=3153301 RepID=UPI0032668EB7